MDWFVNYWHSPSRSTSLNLAIARFWVCSLAALKVMAYPFAGVSAFPPELFPAHAQVFWPQTMQHGQWIGWEQTLVTCCLGACAIGVAPGITAFLSAFLLSHLTALVWPISFEKTWLLAIYFLLLYGLYRHDDHLVFWPKKSPDGSRFSREPEPAKTDGVQLNALKWFLVTIAVIYFFTGLHKLNEGGWKVEWASSLNMTRMLERRAYTRGEILSPLSQWLVSHPFLLGGLGWGTLTLELGLLVAVFTNRLLTPCLLGLAFMHLSIWDSMRVNYFTDFVAMYLVFIPWDTILTAVRRRSQAS